MPSLYAEYVKEREGKETIENDTGFITYLDLKPSKTIYLSDMYIKPEFRKTGAARSLYNELLAVLQEKKYNTMISSYDMDTNNWEHTEKMLENEGFKKAHKYGTLMYLIKDFNYG